MQVKKWTHVGTGETYSYTHNFLSNWSASDETEMQYQDYQDKIGVCVCVCVCVCECVCVLLYC